MTSVQRGTGQQLPQVCPVGAKAAWPLWPWGSGHTCEPHYGEKAGLARAMMEFTGPEENNV